jgi:hypothetical protein
LINSGAQIAGAKQIYLGATLKSQEQIKSPQLLRFCRRNKSSLLSFCALVAAPARLPQGLRFCRRACAFAAETNPIYLGAARLPQLLRFCRKACAFVAEQNPIYLGAALLSQEQIKST